MKNLKGASMNIKKIRTSWGLSGREFCALIGYQDSRTIRRIEAGGQEISGAAKKLIRIYCENPDILKKELMQLTPPSE